jgi:hypothetical protein
MSSGDDVAPEQGTVGQFAERMRDEYGVDLGQQFTDGFDNMSDIIDNAQHQQLTQDDTPPQPGQQAHDFRGTELLTGQTVHDADHWLGKAVDGAGELVGGQFQATGDWSGGVIEDAATPLEHRVYTPGEQPEGEKNTSWVLPDGSTEGAGAFDEGFDRGYDTGWNEGYDQAAEDWSDALSDDLPGMWE